MNDMPVVGSRSGSNVGRQSSPGIYEEQDCPVCNNAGYNVLPTYSHNEWTIAQCDNCNFVYLRNPPGYEAMVEEFAWEKTSKKEQTRRLDERPAWAWLSRRSRWRLGLFGRSFDKVAKHMPAGKILNVGCGVGTMNVGRNGIPYGIEISRSLHKIANERMMKEGGYAIHAPAVEGAAQFDDDFFDGVIMFSYLEHEQQPRKILGEVSRILKKSGKAYVRVPNFGCLNRRFMQKKWCGFRYPDHVNYFTVHSLKKLADEFGFDFKLLNWPIIHFDDNINAILVKR